jgi:hypothetical protein
MGGCGALTNNNVINNVIIANQRFPYVPYFPRSPLCPFMPLVSKPRRETINGVLCSYKEAII